MESTSTDGQRGDEMSAPTFDAEREARLRFLLVEFALGNESAKTFDVEEMRCLRDDVEAMIGEIDRLRATSSSSTPLSETPSEPIRACDYADKSPAHRDKPATRNVRGYRICEDCYVAMREAERQWDEAQVRASLAPLSEPTSEGT